MSIACKNVRVCVCVHVALAVSAPFDGAGERSVAGALIAAWSYWQLPIGCLVAAAMLSNV